MGNKVRRLFVDANEDAGLWATTALELVVVFEASSGLENRHQRWSGAR